MKRARHVLRRLRKNQKGFTLIEMLVVISILGILAAVVTLSMVGVTAFARSNALKTEQTTVQTALDSLASANNQASNEICTIGSPGTSDMTSFPKSNMSIYPGYIRQKSTQQSYYCDSQGVVHGSTSG